MTKYNNNIYNSIYNSTVLEYVTELLRNGWTDANVFLGVQVVPWFIYILKKAAQNKKRLRDQRVIINTAQT